MMMAKDKGNKVFREVMKGTRDRTNSDAERKRNADLEARTKREADRLKRETDKTNAEMERQRRADAAHARAEEDRRKRGK
jgi:hypothetical protein